MADLDALVSHCAAPSESREELFVGGKSRGVALAAGAPRRVPPRARAGAASFVGSALRSSQRSNSATAMSFACRAARFGPPARCTPTRSPTRRPAPRMPPRRSARVASSPCPHLPRSTLFPLRPGTWHRAARAVQPLRPARHHRPPPTRTRTQSQEAGGAGERRRTGQRTPWSNANAPSHGTHTGHNRPDSAGSGRTQAERNSAAEPNLARRGTAN